MCIAGAISTGALVAKIVLDSKSSAMPEAVRARNDAEAGATITSSAS